MSQNKAFRLYRFVDSKFQFMGLRLEQYVVLMGGLFFFFISEEISMKALAFILTSVVFSHQKRLSKRFEGVSWQSYLNWTLGVNMGLGKHYPKSSCRRIVGD
jgi:hypothetical protein